MTNNKRRFLLALLLCVALTLGVMVFAADSASIKTPQSTGLTNFTLSPQALDAENTPKLSPFTLANGQSLPDRLYEYTYTVPEGTESVTISFTSSDKNGFFVEKENGTVSFADFTKLETRPADSDCITEATVTLVNGKGSTGCILPYVVGGYTGTADNPTTIDSWKVANFYVYQFHFEAKSAASSITENLPTRAVYKLNENVTPLNITVSAPTSNIEYTWYQGKTSETVSTVIESANTSTYTPEATSVGVTYYRVEATVTETDKEPVTLRSATTKFVVKDPDVQFSLQTYMTRKLQKVEDSDQLYTLPEKLDGETQRKLLYVSLGKLTGTIPDGVEITRIWSGSASDTLDLTQEGALEVDYDTNTFTIDVPKAQGPEQAYLISNIGKITSYQHLLGRCLYLQTSDGKVYTIAMDSESCNNAHKGYLPETVELIGADGSVLNDFQVQVSAGEAPTGSVYQKTLTSSTPAILRARVKNRDDLVGQQVTDTTRYNTWKQTQENWILVNGQPIGGSFHGQTDAADGTSDAFTLNRGWNVVEVYTNFAPYFLTNNTTVQSPSKSGMFAKNFVAADGKVYYFKSVIETSVVYLINYDGDTATNVPQSSQTDTSLQEVQALRSGVTNSLIEACPIRKTDSGYELTLPQTFNTNQAEATLLNEYTHAVLMAATPKVPGATATFSGSDGLVVGECVADGAFLNMEALYGKDKSFTITVTAADGKTTTDYPVNVVYASSVTSPTISTVDVTLDVPFDENTYTYYLNYYDKLATDGYLNVSLPAGATATVNGGEAFSGEKQITVTPLNDFYRLTITAADGTTEKSYYFVTRYTKDGTVPYATISQDSKNLAKEMLWKYYETLNSTEYFPEYWNIFRAKAATGAEGVEAYNFDNKYVMHPAWHKMNYTTDWAACILEIVMLGYNPYDFPYYGGSEPDEHFNYVDALKTADNSAFSSAVWYQFARKVVGDPISGKMSAEKGFALNKDYEWLDIRAWAIASLAGSEPKDMVRYVDTLHNEQVTNSSSEFKSLWDNSNGVGDGTNPNTVGCVLSAIAAAGADPDKQFVYDGAKPLETIKETMYREDGLFYSGKNSTQEGALSKDIIIGLGDVMHGSNVWDRYALTAEKYNALIEKAKKLGVSVDGVPTEFVEADENVSRAYFSLYQKVADELEKTGDTSMRPKVIWGMPYEIFADAVNEMPEASELKDSDLDDLEELIAQYEAMDNSNRKSIASAVLTKYQELVAKGLALKGGSSSKADELYKKILALPNASGITDSNKEQTKASVKEIRDAMSDADKALLKWAGDSVLSKLEAVEKELEEEPTEKVSVTVLFSLSDDDRFVTSDSAALSNIPIEVTYFDLANYGLERYYCCDDTGSPIEQPTMLHLFITALEQYELGLDADSCGLGELANSSKYKDLLTVSGSAGSMYMTSFWNHDQNLTYFYNGDYPLESKGRGTTADQILLKDGDFVDVAMYSDWSFYTEQESGFHFFSADGKTPQKTFTVEKSADLNLTYLLAHADMNGSSAVYTSVPGTTVYYAKSMNSSDAYTAVTNETDGTVTLKFTDAGTWYVWTYGAKGGTNKSVISAPGCATVTVTPSQAEIDQAKADKVKSLIAAIGTVTLDSKSAIDTARSAYEQLTDEQKALVSNYDVLVAAEARYAQLVDEAAAAAVDSLIEAIGPAGEVNSDSGLLIRRARSEYSKLTEAQKTLVTKYADLLACEEAYDRYQTAKEMQFNVTPATVTATNENGIIKLVGYLEQGQTWTLSYQGKELTVENGKLTCNGISFTVDATGVIEKPAVVEVEEAAPSIPEPDLSEIPDERKNDVTQAAAEIKQSENTGSEGLGGAAAGKLIAEGQNKAKEAEIEENQTVEVTAKPSLEIKVVDVVTDETKNQQILTLDITPQVVYTTTVKDEATGTSVSTTSEPEKIANSDIKAPITISIPLPAGMSAENLYIKHYFSDREGFEFIRVLVEERDGVKIATWQQSSFSKVELLADSRSASVSFGDEQVTLTPEGVGKELPTASKDGKIFTGWTFKIGGEEFPGGPYTKLTDELLTALDNARKSGTDVTATPNFKERSSSGSSVKTESPNKPKTDAVIDASKFVDVSRSDWFYNAVQYALENGLMNGTSASEFSPNAATTRGMIVTILARGEGVDTNGTPWYGEGQKWAMQNGISDGTNMPGVITREQLATILFRYAKLKGYDTSKSASLKDFPDAGSVSSYAVDAMQWAVAEGLITGMSGKLNPQGSATRAQAATILMRFAEKIAK